MTYEETRKDAHLFLSLTSLHVDEFDTLCEEFEKDWWAYYRHHTVRGQRRKTPLYQEHGSSSLPTTEAKLFFLLVYLKQYPLQCFQAASFGLSIGKTNEWIGILLKSLKVTLGRLRMLPCRDGDLLEGVLEKMDVATVNLDATDCAFAKPLRRSKDAECGARWTSTLQWEKKAHTVKNNLLVSDAQEVVYLSGTYEGKVHDKKICDEENCRYPQGIEIRQDLGYKGHKPDGTRITEPARKPKGRELNPEQKEANRGISKLRVVVEHAISGIKRCRAVKDVNRNIGHAIKDLLMEICCGLHNLGSEALFVRTHVRQHALTRI